MGQTTSDEQLWRFGLSLGLAVLSWSVFLVLLIGMLSPLGQAAGPVNPLLAFPLLYCLLGFVPTSVGVLAGLMESRRRSRRRHAIAGVVLNAILLAGYCRFFWFAAQQ